MHQIQLTASDREKLQREVTGDGGIQTLLRKLQSQINGDVLTVSDDDLRRALNYFNGQQGGWQDRLAPIAAHAQHHGMT